MPKGVYSRKKKSRPQRQRARVVVKEAETPAEVQANVEASRAVAAEASDEIAAKKLAAYDEAAAKATLGSGLLAEVMDGFADMIARTPPGTAHACKVGKAWVGVMDHYFPAGAVEHPIVAAVWATGQFAAAAWVLSSARKKTEKAKAKNGVEDKGVKVKASKDQKPGDNLFDGVPT